MSSPPRRGARHGRPGPGHTTTARSARAVRCATAASSQVAGSRIDRVSASRLPLSQSFAKRPVRRRAVAGHGDQGKVAERLQRGLADVGRSRPAWPRPPRSACQRERSGHRPTATAPSRPAAGRARPAGPPAAACGPSTCSATRIPGPRARPRCAPCAGSGRRRACCGSPRGAPHRRGSGPRRHAMPCEAVTATVRPAAYAAHRRLRANGRDVTTDIPPPCRTTPWPVMPCLSKTRLDKNESSVGCNSSPVNRLRGSGSV